MGAGGAQSERHGHSAAKIAYALQTRGQYITRVDRVPHQRLVDVQWTAYRAARLLGIRVRVAVDAPTRSDDPFVTITVSPRLQDRVQA